MVILTETQMLFGFIYYLGIFFLGWLAFYVDKHQEELGKMNEDDVRLITILSIIWPLSIGLFLFSEIVRLVVRFIIKIIKYIIRRLK